MQELTKMSRENIKKLAEMIKQYKTQKTKIKEDYYYETKKLTSMIKDLEKKLKVERDIHKKRGPVYLRHRNKKIYNAFTNLLDKHKFMRDVFPKLSKKFKLSQYTIRKIIKREEHNSLVERVNRVDNPYIRSQWAEYLAHEEAKIKRSY